MVKPQLCKTFEEQVEFSVADSEGEAAAVISAIQRRSARLLQLAEDLQLACHSARNMTGYQALQLKQQLAAWNDAAADRHALGEAGLEGICRGIEQLLDGGSAVSEYKLAEEATLNNKVDAASLLVDAAGPKSGALGLPRSPSSAALLTRSPSSAELGAGRAPSAGASRRGSLTEPPSRGASGGQLTPKPNSLDIPRSPSLSRAGSLKEPPPLSPSSSARKLAPLPELARVPSMRHVSSDQCIKPGASLAPGFPSAFPSAFPAASKMSMAIAERFVGRAGWEADCWQLYLAVSEAAIAGSTRGFPFTVTADQLVDAYALNDHQASSLRGRLDRARGDSADETLRLCCYLGSMRAGATEHERLHQQLLELEACNGKKVRRRHGAGAAAPSPPLPPPPARAAWQACTAGLDDAHAWRWAARVLPAQQQPALALQALRLNCTALTPPPPWRPAGLHRPGQPGSVHCRPPGGRQEGLPGSCRPAAGRAQASGAQVLPPGGPVQQVQGPAHAGRAVPRTPGGNQGWVSHATALASVLDRGWCPFAHRLCFQLRVPPAVVIDSPSYTFTARHA
jgi:hypothetical protein